MTGLSRNQRRNATKKRLACKTARIIVAHKAAELESVRAIVQANREGPRPERNLYKCSMTVLKSTSHRGYVCNNVKSDRFAGERALEIKRLTALRK
jgi:hypothetical protein